jgi:hypothetical protein
MSYFNAQDGDHAEEGCFCHRICYLIVGLGPCPRIELSPEGIIIATHLDAHKDDYVEDFDHALRLN